MHISVKHLRSNLEKFRGLMFCDKLENVYFESRYGIHTFFLRQHIDVLILNENCEVIRMRQDLKPWRVFIWNPKYRKVIEVKSGFIKKYDMQLGQKINLKFVSETDNISP